MGAFDCAAVTLPACRAVLQRLTEEDLSAPRRAPSTPSAMSVSTWCGPWCCWPPSPASRSTPPLPVRPTPRWRQPPKRRWRPGGTAGSTARWRSDAACCRPAWPSRSCRSSCSCTVGTSPMRPGTTSMSRPRSRPTSWTAPGSSSPRTSGVEASPPRCLPERRPRSCSGRSRSPAGRRRPAQPPVTVIETAGRASSDTSTNSPAWRAVAAARLTTVPVAASVPGSVAV